VPAAAAAGESPPPAGADPADVAAPLPAAVEPLPAAGVAGGVTSAGTVMVFAERTADWSSGVS
jgi:hypothetical protein